MPRTHVPLANEKKSSPGFTARSRPAVSMPAVKVCAASGFGAGGGACVHAVEIAASVKAAAAHARMV
ncbi:MAG: hypothetical protein QM736_20750 [Vicinamibacterales bacterium]